MPVRLRERATAGTIPTHNARRVSGTSARVEDGSCVALLRWRAEGGDQPGADRIARESPRVRGDRGQLPTRLQLPGGYGRALSDFYWSSVSPHLQEAMTYLNVTAAGRQWIANLHNHVFCAQHDFA